MVRRTGITLGRASGCRLERTPRLFWQAAWTVPMTPGLALYRVHGLHRRRVVIETRAGLVVVPTTLALSAAITPALAWGRGWA